MIMNRSSRRHFLAVTGAGAAAAGAATVLPSALGGAQHSAAQQIDQTDFDAGAGAPLSETMLMACVTDASAGEVTVINGAHEITVSDPNLARRIAQLSRKEA
jgi:hypothetical protein